MILSHFDLQGPLKLSQTTYISNQTYSQPHIPGALSLTSVILVTMIFEENVAFHWFQMLLSDCVNNLNYHFNQANISFKRLYHNGHFLLEMQEFTTNLLVPRFPLKNPAWQCFCYQKIPMLHKFFLSLNCKSLCFGKQISSSIMSYFSA